VTRRYVLSPLAQDDIDGIVDYTATRWGFDQAAIYLNQIRQHIEAVAAFPKSGRPCPQVGPAFYRTKTGSHVVVYRVTDDGIDVARVLHESMDLPRHF
jgi:toxin ParE1/3/4